MTISELLLAIAVMLCGVRTHGCNRRPSIRCASSPVSAGTYPRIHRYNISSTPLDDVLRCSSRTKKITSNLHCNSWDCSNDPHSAGTPTPCRWPCADRFNHFIPHHFYCCGVKSSSVLYLSFLLHIQDAALTIRVSGTLLIARPLTEPAPPENYIQITTLSNRCSSTP